MTNKELQDGLREIFGSLRDYSLRKNRGEISFCIPLPTTETYIHAQQVIRFLGECSLTVTTTLSDLSPGILGAHAKMLRLMGSRARTMVVISDINFGRLKIVEKG